MTMADDQGQGPDDQSTDDAGTDDQGRDDSGDDSQNDGDSGAQDTVSRADYDRLFSRMQAADKAKSAAEAKLREKDQADMTELERSKAQLEEHKTRADAAEDRLKAMIVENAFHRENKHVWHDVGDAIAALDLSGVEIGEDGKVTGMANAIKDVVKRKPHYVKSDDEGDGSGPPAANSASNGQRKGESRNAIDRAKMAARFPALGK